MTPLRAPADADNYRVKAGRFGDRFYTDPLPADDTWPATTDDDIYPAISTVKKATGQDWSKAMVKRLAKNPSQLVEIGQLADEFERKQRLNIVDEGGLGKASNRGTIVHAHAEAVLMNRLPLYEMNEEVKPYIRTLDHFFATYTPTLMAAEFVAINRHLNDHNVARGNSYLGYGGTGDAVIEIDGKLWLVDWKSRAADSDHGAYAEEGAQVSAYGRADYWIVGCDESPNGAKRVKPPDLAGGLIVSIKPDSYECFPIDLDEGMAYWVDLHAWWQARRSERRSIGRKWAPRVPATSELVDQSPVAGPPTPASNRERFDALPDIKKGWAREAFKRKGLNPNNPGTAGEVSRLLGEVENRPTLREAQETAAEQRAASTERGEDGRFVRQDSGIVTECANMEPWQRIDGEMEGGEAPDALIAEARLKFDMVLTDGSRGWTGFRVKEANEAGVPFHLSKLRSMRRVNLYLMLCEWAAFRQGLSERHLIEDEELGNIEFAGLLFIVDQCEDSSVPLGARLGRLSTEQVERFASLVSEAVEYEIGGNPAAGPESQPETETE